MNRSFLVQSVSGSFLFAPLKLALSKFCIWNSGISQYLSHDYSLFTDFETLSNQSLVKSLKGEVTPLGVGFI